MDFAFDLSHEPIKHDSAASAQPVVAEQVWNRLVRSMNLALGNMVYLAHDLGFAVKTTKKQTYDAGKIALRIEGQLQGLREIYRQESVNKDPLLGGILLQFNISSSGEVTQVKDMSSLITDVNFRKAVIGEVAKWSFADVVSEPVIVSCPLLFVHEVWILRLCALGKRPRSFH